MPATAYLRFTNTQHTPTVKVLPDENFGSTDTQTFTQLDSTAASTSLSAKMAAQVTSSLRFAAGTPAGSHRAVLRELAALDDSGQAVG